MKALAFVFAVSALTVTQAQADELKLVCRELSGPRTTLVVSIDPGQESKLGRGGSLDEGVKYAYTLELYTKDQSYRSLEVKGTVETEDVNFVFESNDKTVYMHVFMDEMDQTTVRVNGKELDMACF